LNARKTRQKENSCSNISSQLKEKAPLYRRIYTRGLFHKEIKHAKISRLPRSVMELDLSNLVRVFELLLKWDLDAGRSD